MSKVPETMIHVDVTESKDRNVEEKEQCFMKLSNVKRFLDYIWKVIKKIYFGFTRFVKKILFSRPIILVLKLPWKIISSLPVIKHFKGPVENMLSNFQDSIKETSEDENNKSNPPLIEEITIPSVTEMAKAGILFVPVNLPISEIRFD